MHKYNVIYAHKKRMVFSELIFREFIYAQQQYICRPIVVNFTHTHTHTHTQDREREREKKEKKKKKSVKYG